MPRHNESALLFSAGGQLFEFTDYAQMKGHGVFRAIETGTVMEAPFGIMQAVTWASKALLEESVK